jgi:hypothetical protein
MGLEKLNEDIIYSICLKSNFEDIINLSKTSKYFKEVIDKNSELIYRNKYVKLSILMVLGASKMRCMDRIMN